MFRAFLYCFVLCVGFVLSGCSISAPKANVAPLTYDSIKPVNLNIADIVITDAYQPPLVAPYVEHTLINPPYRAAYNLMQNSFSAKGSDNEAHFTIKKASIVSEQTDDNISSFRFWQNQSARLYTAQIIVDIELKQKQPPFSELGRGDVVVTRSLKIPEQASVLEKEEALNGMVRAMMADVKVGMKDVLNKNLKITFE